MADHARTIDRVGVALSVLHAVLSVNDVRVVLRSPIVPELAQPVVFQSWPLILHLLVPLGEERK